MQKRASSNFLEIGKLDSVSKSPQKRKREEEKKKRNGEVIYNLAKDIRNGYNTRMNCVAFIYVCTYPILRAESCYRLAERQIVHRVEIETNPGNDDIVCSKYGRILNENSR